MMDRPPNRASEKEIRRLVAVADEQAGLREVELQEQTRRSEAFTLRIAGFTFKQIADRLGCDVDKAVHYVREAEGVPTESVEDLRTVENARLDRAQSAIWGRVLQGDDKAIDVFLRISVRRSQLNGMNAPTKIDIRVGVKAEMEAALAELENVVLGQVVQGEIIGDD